MKIAILDDYLGVALDCADWRELSQRADIKVFREPLSVPDEAARVLQSFDILCTLRERMPMPRALIEKLPHLKYIAVTGKRYDTIDVAAATDHGIVVSNSLVGQSGGGGGVTELVFGLLLSLARNISFEDRMMRSGHWQNRLGTNLRGKTLGILGLGSLGKGVATLAKAFGMNVIAWSQNMTDAQATAVGARRVEKGTLFQESDFVSIHLAYSERTHHIVGHAELEQMKPTAFLINTARSRIVDGDALLAALRNGQIAGAALDVYDVEPLPSDDPLRTLNNVVLTPHLGYFTRDMLVTFYTDAVEAITAFLDAKPIRVVNPDVFSGDYRSRSLLHSKP